MAEDTRLHLIKDVIKQVADDRFAGRTIVDVSVKEDTDFDGDPIFVVRVVFDEAEGYLDPRKTVGITRHVRSKLSEMKEYAFPIFSFISSADLKEQAA